MYVICNTSLLLHLDNKTDLVQFFTLSHVYVPFKCQRVILHTHDTEMLFQQVNGTGSGKWSTGYALPNNYLNDHRQRVISRPWACIKEMQNADMISFNTVTQHSYKLKKKKNVL